MVDGNLYWADNKQCLLSSYTVAAAVLGLFILVPPSGLNFICSVLNVCALKKARCMDCMVQFLVELIARLCLLLM